MRTTTVMKLMPFGFEDQGWLYLQSFDLEKPSVKLTYDIAKAHRFETLDDAVSTWKRQSLTQPYRPDGQPNRPLTAYHATFERLGD